VISVPMGVAASPVRPEATDRELVADAGPAPDLLRRPGWVNTVKARSIGVSTTTCLRTVAASVWPLGHLSLRFRGIDVPGQRPLPICLELIPQRRQRDRVEPGYPARSHWHVLHQPSVLKDLQVLRHRQPANRHPGGQLPDSLRPLGQARHNGQTRAITQRTPPDGISVSIH
jgi:hypothetical protein